MRLHGTACSLNHDDATVASSTQSLLCLMFMVTVNSRNKQNAKNDLQNLTKCSSLYHSTIIYHVFRVCCEKYRLLALMIKLGESHWIAKWTNESNESRKMTFRNWQNVPHYTAVRNCSTSWETVLLFSATCRRIVYGLSFVHCATVTMTHIHVMKAAGCSGCGAFNKGGSSLTILFE